MRDRIRQASNTAAPRPGASRTIAFTSTGRPCSVPRRRTRPMQRARRPPINVVSSPLPRNASHRVPPATGWHEHARRESGRVAAHSPHSARSLVPYRASVRIDCIARSKRADDLRQSPACAVRTTRTAQTADGVDATALRRRRPVPARGAACGTRERDRLDAHQAGTGAGRLQ
jgi:hypothetical protein